MKVLMISKALVASTFHGKLQELSRLGLDVTLVVPRRWGSQELENVQPDGYRLEVMECRFSGSHHFHFYPGLARVIGSDHWDVIHIDEEPFNYAAYQSTKLSSGNGTRSVFFTWQNLLKTYPPPFSLFEKGVFQKAAGAIAGSAEAGEVLRKRGFEKPVVVVPQFGVSPDVFCRQDRSGLRRRLGLEGFVVGYVGRIVREKGLDTLARAFAGLSGESRLVLVGSGPFEKTLKQLIESVGVSERTRWIPWVDSRQVPEYLNAFDLLVLPSRTCRHWKEQFGRVLVEAMACETCVVGSDSGEIPTVIGDAGLVFREGEDIELGGHLRCLMDDPALRCELGRRGRQRVLEHFTHAKIAADTASLYKHVCAS